MLQGPRCDSPCVPPPLQEFAHRTRPPVSHEAHDVRIQDLSADEIEAVLSAVGEDIRANDLLAIQQFVQRIGGMANARLAIETLREIEDAA